MSYHVFFSFSVGLEKTIHAPKGELDRIKAHIAGVEAALGLKATQYRDNPPRWANVREAVELADDKAACDVAEEHNEWVRRLYHSFALWSEKPCEGGDAITPERAREFWCGLTEIDVPPEKWTADYYQARMDTLYEVMRGRETDGVSFGETPLTPQQASAVINLFSEFLDTRDIRLTVCRDEDQLRRSDDGGYEWCYHCGGIAEDEVLDEIRNCRRHDPCDLRDQCAGSYLDEDEIKGLNATLDAERKAKRKGRAKARKGG